MASLYSFVLVLHIGSIAVAFGATAGYPLLLTGVRRADPHALPALHRANRRVGNAVVAPAAALALLTGVYLATAGGFWGEIWVSLPLSILIFFLALHGAFFMPTERRLEGLASGAAAGSPSNDPRYSAAYGAVARRLMVVSYLSSASILLALALMVMKPS
jgi:uncharacterized membrane protein